MKTHIIGIVSALLLVSACQSNSTSTAELESGGTFDTGKPAPTETASTAAAVKPASGGTCAIALASGPPPKPSKGADFAKNAVGKNLVRNVGRNILGNVIGGGAIGASVASQVVRTEQDLGGKWMFTDGSKNCGCEIQIRTGAGVVAQGFGRTSGYKLKDAKGGSMKNISCSTPQLASANRFALGYSFTGYDATLAIEGGKGQPVAELKRDGINYFSGSLSDGTPVTMWRRDS